MANQTSTNADLQEKSEDCISPSSPTRTESSATTAVAGGDVVIDIAEDSSDDSSSSVEETINGYPRLAAFQCSEDNFGLYRAFDYLHSRTILDLQAELSCLEQELELLDGLDVHPDATPDNLEGSLRLKDRAHDIEACLKPGSARTRVTVLKDIRDTLDEYDRLLVNARAVSSFQRPSNRVYRNVRKYMHNTKPLCDADMRSIRCKEDIITLRQGREYANFDGVVERALRCVDVHILQPIFKTKKPPLEVCPPARFLCTPELHKKTTNKYIHYYSSSRINRVVGMIITVVIFILLIVPVITMYRLTSFGNQATTLDAVGILIVFTMLFSAAMSLLTKASRHELFAASAAYCAILVVFISNFGNQ
ncbi:hypothetical protein LTR97_002651 [Elasticomyces elasticus]|uniref:DUF6594 domain-containing protein n=1 Tax=Elasticomyces elasticus TaxID=574655 RepID=A0AAN7WI31_9PEZI|nr:hypothetical protein LTR97_002651 [Elasticomyces elasticus]